MDTPTVPTISITNSIAFANMKDAQSEFGIVRMGGTIGWILAAWPFVFILVDYDKVQAANAHGLKEWLGAVLANPLTGDAAKAGARSTYIVAGVASLLLAAFSFVSLLRDSRWRWWAQAAMWGALAGVVAFYWSTR